LPRSISSITLELDQIRRWTITGIWAVLIACLVIVDVDATAELGTASASGDSALVTGARAFETEDYDVAIAAFSQAINHADRPQARSVAYANRCRVYLATKQWPAAIADCTQAIEWQADQELAYLHRGLAYQALGDLVRADRDFSDALRLVPLDGRAWYNRGLVRASQGQAPAAIADFNHALVQFGATTLTELAQVYYDRAIVWLETGNPTQALHDLDRVVRHDPSHAQAFHNRGRILQRLGQVDQARTSLDRAIALDPMNGGPYLERALLNHRMHCLGAAIADLECAARCFYDCGDLAAYEFAMTLIHQLQSHQTAIG
jgi:tetratricopeptide (TPR) repeat protein